MINAHQSGSWKIEITAAVMRYNEWFLHGGQQAFREARAALAAEVHVVLATTSDLRRITPDALLAHPPILASLRMSTVPPLSRERLVLLADTAKPLVTTLEQGRLPARMSPSEVRRHLNRICAVVTELLDPEILTWVRESRAPDALERERAAMAIADRRSDAVADVTLRQAQKRRQYQIIGSWLSARGYQECQQPGTPDLTQMAPGSYTLGQPIVVGSHASLEIPMDAVIQPRRPRANRVPLFLEAVSPADPMRSGSVGKGTVRTKLVRTTYGPEATLLLLVGGMVDVDYLRTRAAEGLDWVWEHRIEDLARAGV